jgi:hypothetical protein
MKNNRLPWISIALPLGSRRSENGQALEQTLEGALDDEGRPVQWSWLMRFTLFPPHDNVIVFCTLIHSISDASQKRC